MKVFISYRRSDSSYLAYLVAERLPQLQPNWKVWTDRPNISAGSTFTDVLDDAIANADIVLAMIGSHWSVSRLQDPNDIVRRELECAAASGRLVIPILHSGGSMPSAEELPETIRWIARRQMLVWENPFEIQTHLDDLVWEIRGRPSRLRALVHQAQKRYYARDDDALTESVTQLWESFSGEPTADTAECYRLMQVAMIRGGNDLDQRLWLARAMSASFLSGASNTLAGCLLPLFFQLSELGALDQAHGVLDEVARLARPGRTEEAIAGGYVQRMVAEKRAYLYYREQDWAIARSTYQEAARLAAASDPRGALKATAAAALCEWQLGDRASALEATRRMLATAEHEAWSDVADTARYNLRQMEDEQSEFTPYEVR